MSKFVKLSLLLDDGGYYSLSVVDDEHIYGRYIYEDGTSHKRIDRRDDDLPKNRSTYSTEKKVAKAFRKYLEKEKGKNI